MRSRVVIFVAALVLIAGAASADVGFFTSFTTTMTPSPGTFQFDVSLETTGAAASSSDTVFMTFYFFNVDASTWGWDNTWLHRDGSANTFSDSYTFTGFIPNHQYKWAISTDEQWTGAPWAGSTWTNFWNYRDSWESDYEDPFFASVISSGSTIITAAGTNGAIWWAENLVSGVASVHQPNLLEVPTLNELGLLALGVALLGFGIFALRRAG